MALRSGSPPPDMVSICVYCREDATIIMNFSPDDDLGQFPTTPIINTSWRLTVRKLIGMISGLSGREISIMRITKFWVPDGPPAFHIIYKVKCPFNEKKQVKLQSSTLGVLRWLSLEQVQSLCLTTQLASPELLEYITQTLQPRTFYPLTGDPEASKEGFDMLNEVVEKHTLVDLEGGFLTPHEQLLKMAHFSLAEQKKIYKEFFLRTFPNRLMNRVQFEKFMVELGWKKEDLPGLFMCADLLSLGGISFRDLLLFLAATDPDTPNGAVSRDIRCQYIFRYFDKNRDNILDPMELRSLATAVSNVKDGSVKPTEIDKIVDNFLNDVGLGGKKSITMGTFVKKVGETKFRGTSSIFRSQTSALKLLSPNKLNESPSALIIASQKQKGPVFSGIPTWRGISLMNINQHLYENTGGLMCCCGVRKTFEIATHAVRLNRLGLMEDIRPVDRVLHGKSASLSDEDHFIRMASLDYYSASSPANELLAALEYFTNETYIKAKSTYKKAPFSWDKFDMNNLKRILITVCEICIKVMEREPRKVNITSPVYILGDLHGNYQDLMVFEQVLWGLGLSLSPCSLLFLGDYVDRGPHGVEVIAYLFAQKAKNPTKMFLLRGNHEIRSIQKAFTFHTECQRKFGEEHFYEVWNMINRVFDVMPLVAVIDSKLFCCHGGIPAPWMCPRMDVIDMIPCPLATPEEESVLAWEIMWNDPLKSENTTPALLQEMAVNEGFAMNMSRKTGRVFSLDALETFLLRNDLSHVIRAHEVKTAGFQIQQGGKLLTVFSSSGYCGGPNEAACIFVSEEKIRVFRINTSL